MSEEKKPVIMVEMNEAARAEQARMAEKAAAPAAESGMSPGFKALAEGRGLKPKDADKALRALPAPAVPKASTGGGGLMEPEPAKPSRGKKLALSLGLAAKKAGHRLAERSALALREKGPEVGKMALSFTQEGPRQVGRAVRRARTGLTRSERARLQQLQDFKDSGVELSEAEKREWATLRGRMLRHQASLKKFARSLVPPRLKA